MMKSTADTSFIHIYHGITQAHGQAQLSTWSWKDYIIWKGYKLHKFLCLKLHSFLHKTNTWVMISFHCFERWTIHIYCKSRKDCINKTYINTLILIEAISGPRKRCVYHTRKPMYVNEYPISLWPYLIFLFIHYPCHHEMNFIFWYFTVFLIFIHIPFYILMNVSK